MRTFRVAHILLILAILGIVSGIVLIYVTEKKPPQAPVPFAPPTSPFLHFIAAEGIVSSCDEDHPVGTPFTEIIETIFVDAGDHVTKGTPLFKLVTKTIEKELEVAKKNYATSLASYEKQLALPRPEAVPPLEAASLQKNMNYLDALSRFELYQNITNPNAVSLDDFNAKKYASLAAKYALEQAEAELCLLKAGAWEKDLAIAKAEIVSKKASMEVINANLERYTVRAPIQGTVLQIKATEGDIAQATSAILQTPLLIMGDLDTIYLRIDINEEDIWRVFPGAQGRAYVRGNSEISTPIQFLRIEPYVTPKKNIRGQTNEVVDTRVLQLMYTFSRENLPVYPGQMMDIFLEAKPYSNLNPAMEKK